MSASRKIQNGGGDSLRPVQNLNLYEGSHYERTETETETGTGKVSGREAHNEAKIEQQKPRQAHKARHFSASASLLTHRRHEDQRHLLHFDYSHQVDHSNKKPPKGSLPATFAERFSDEEMESSPFIEDKNKELRLQRQREYHQELSQQIAQREEQRLLQKAKKNFRAAQRSQQAAAAAALDSRSAVERYENQLRMEQLQDMRKQLQLQREREVQKLRRIYRKDDRKLLAHLQRLKLQDADLHGHGEGDVTTQKEVAYHSKTKLSPSTQATDSKTSELKSEVTQSKLSVTLPNLEVSYTDASKTAASPKETPSRKKSEKEEEKEIVKTTQPSLTSTARAVEKPPTKPLTYKRAYLRLQQRRREEERMLEERRAKAAAWRADIARQERLERDVCNMAEWRSSHSLAGVPLKPIAPTQRGRFEAAASWLERQRTVQQEKSLERDRQLMSWREGKNRQINERRSKEKAEQKVAKEIQAERRIEAEKCFDRWLQEIRARKAAEKASVPRGAIGVSTYSWAYSLPSPCRQPPRQAWRQRSIISTS